MAEQVRGEGGEGGGGELHLPRATTRVALASRTAARVTFASHTTARVPFAPPHHHTHDSHLTHHHAQHLVPHTPPRTSPRAHQVYREYQRQLWDPALGGDGQAPVGCSKASGHGEWHFHRFGTVSRVGDGAE